MPVRLHDRVVRTLEQLHEPATPRDQEAVSPSAVFRSGRARGLRRVRNRRTMSWPNHVHQGLQHEVDLPASARDRSPQNGTVCLPVVGSCDTGAVTADPGAPLRALLTEAGFAGSAHWWIEPQSASGSPSRPFEIEPSSTSSGLSKRSKSGRPLATSTPSSMPSAPSTASPTGSSTSRGSTDQGSPAASAWKRLPGCTWLLRASSRS